MSCVHRESTFRRLIYLFLFLLPFTAACAPSATVDPPQLQVVTPTVVPAIPTPNQQLITPTLGDSATTTPSTAIRSINVQTDERAGVPVRQSFRPIPTVDAANLNRNQNTFAATRTPSPLETEVATQRLTRQELSTRIDSARAEIQNVAFVLEASKDTNAIDCSEVTRSYGRIFENTLDFDVPDELALVFEQYDLALNIFAVKLIDLDARCRTFANDPNLQVSHIIVGSFEPEALIPNAMENAAIALQHIYDAQLWLSADVLKTDALYAALQEQLRRYEALLETAAVDNCADIETEFEAVFDTVQLLSPPIGSRRDTYHQYLEAAEIVQPSGDALLAFCQAEEAGTQVETSDLPADLLTNATRDTALALEMMADVLDPPSAEIAPLPTYTPAPNVVTVPTVVPNRSAPLDSDSPISAELVRVQPSNATHLYEVVLRIAIQSNNGPFRVFIGGFNMDPSTNLLTVTVQCDRSFQDRVIMIDNSGTTYSSNIVQASRGDACPRYGTTDWPTATPHPTLTPKPQPTKYPTNTPLPTYTPWATSQP